jgi:hypothetical protein
MLLNISALAGYTSIPAGVISLYDKAAVLGAMINEMLFTALNRKSWRILGNFKASNALSINGDHGTGSSFIFFFSLHCKKVIPISHKHNYIKFISYTMVGS